MRRTECVNAHARVCEGRGSVTTPPTRPHVKHLRADNPIRQLVNALIDRTGLDKDKIANALLKVKVSSRQGTLQSISQDLLDAVSECPGLSQQPYVVVAQIAKALQTLTAHASASVWTDPCRNVTPPGQTSRPW